MSEQIDKSAETRAHIRQVQRRMNWASSDIVRRALQHDASKLQEPELSGFYAMNEVSQRADVAYGSPEYAALMDSQAHIIRHHYARNDHHPEHWRYHAPTAWMAHEPSVDPHDTEAGVLISCMSLPALIEMLCDWDAAAMRYKGGSFAGSFRRNCERFGIADQLAAILLNTAVAYGFVSDDEAAQL